MTSNRHVKHAEKHVDDMIMTELIRQQQDTERTLETVHNTTGVLGTHWYRTMNVPLVYGINKHMEAVIQSTSQHPHHTRATYSTAFS